MKIIISILILICLSCGSRNYEITSQFHLSNEALKGTIVNFRASYDPNCEKIIQVKLYENSPIVVFEIGIIGYPHMFNSNLQYFILDIEGCPVFVLDELSRYFDLPIDTNEIKRFIVEKYPSMASQEYEIDPNGFSTDWYFIDKQEPVIFNMGDSVKKFGDMEAQFLKMNKIIYEPHMAGE